MGERRENLKALALYAAVPAYLIVANHYVSDPELGWFGLFWPLFIPAYLALGHVLAFAAFLPVGWPAALVAMGLSLAVQFSIIWAWNRWRDRREAPR